jgi:hypothetical protein
MDTIMIIRDSVACCINNTAEMSQPCMKEVGNSCNDVAIVGIICGTILFLAIIAVVAYFIQKGCERKAQKNVAEKKREQEIKDRKEKQKADLQSKLLSHWESLIYETKEVDVEDKLEDQKAEAEGEKSKKKPRMKKVKEMRVYNKTAGDKFVTEIQNIINAIKVEE